MKCSVLFLLTFDKEIASLPNAYMANLKTTLSVYNDSLLKSFLHLYLLALTVLMM